MSDMEKVLEVLTNATEYPAPAPPSARSMLAEGLPHALAASGAHSFQEEIAGLTAGMLAEVRASAESILASACEQVSEAEAQLRTVDDERVAAAERHSQAQAEAEAREAARDEAKATVKDNEALHKEAKQAESAYLHEKGLLSERKSQLDALAASIRAHEESQAEAPLDEIVAYLEEVGAEKALIAAVPGALERTPAERGAFDAITLAEVNELLSQSLASLAAEIAEGAQTERHASAEAMGAWAVLDISEGRSADAAAALCSAQEGQEAALAERQAAEALAQTRSAAVTDALVQRTLAEEKVSEAAGAEAALATLRSPPAPPAVEEEAAPAVEVEAMEVEAAPEAEAAPMEVDAAENEVADLAKMPPAEVGMDIVSAPLGA